MTGQGQSEVLHFIMSPGIVNDPYEGNHHHFFNSLIKPCR
jgi:hypothetical protein